MAIALQNLLSKRMSYLMQRQDVIARNVGNADTAGYRAQDLTPFQQIMSASGGGSPTGLRVTNARHITAAGGLAGAGATAVNERKPYEVLPSGNSVSLEHEMLKLAETTQDYSVTTSIYRKLHGLFRTALGKGA